MAVWFSRTGRCIFIHKKLIGGIIGAGRGFIGGGPLGAISGGVRGFQRGSRIVNTRQEPFRGFGGGGGFAGGGAGGRMPAFPQPRRGGDFGVGSLRPHVPQPGRGTQGICNTPEARLFLGACCGSSGRGNGRVNVAGECAPPGFHWNRSTYCTLGGPCSNSPAGVVERETKLVRNRKKFNTANGAARNRAIARLKAGEKDAKAALKAVGYRTISKQSSREMRMRRRGHR